VRIMSVPARAALTASTLGHNPRAFAVPSSESVIVTPVNPRSWRSSVTPIAWDQPAALRGSYAVYVALDSMITGMSCPIAPRYGRRPGVSVARDALMVTTLASVLSAEPPRGCRRLRQERA